MFSKGQKIESKVLSSRKYEVVEATNGSNYYLLKNLTTQFTFPQEKNVVERKYRISKPCVSTRRFIFNDKNDVNGVSLA